MQLCRRASSSLTSPLLSYLRSKTTSSRGKLVQDYQFSQKRWSSGGFGQDPKFDFSQYDGRPDEHRYKVDGYSKEAFRIFDKRTGEFAIHKGSLIITPQKYYAWRPRSWEQFNERDLGELLQTVVPKQNLSRSRTHGHQQLLIVLGSGPSIEHIDEKIQQSSVNLVQVNFEVEATDDACATFNMLSEEGRNVVGAFITISDKDS